MVSPDRVYQEPFLQSHTSWLTSLEDRPWDDSTRKVVLGSASTSLRNQILQISMNTAYAHPMFPIFTCMYVSLVGLLKGA